MKRILILGIDGYLGWPLSLYLLERGYIVGGVDNLSRRQRVKDVGGRSVTDILAYKKRRTVFDALSGGGLLFDAFDICNYGKLSQVMRSFGPDVIVHLAEQPSAPYSMLGHKAADSTMTNNVNGTLGLLFAMRDICPEAHLVKLGTMGEYGTPNIPIEEGFLDVEVDGRKDRLPFPKQAGSWYHWTKVHDSNNIMFACKVWGLKSTDIMQGVVYGSRIDEMKSNPKLATRVDFDSVFGTVINRFCVQAVLGHPLTIYGAGGQTRGFIPLQDSIECMFRAIDHPPEGGEYRVVNQLEKTYSIKELAKIVAKVAKMRGHDSYVEHYENPRVEMEDHFYQVNRKKLASWGYVPKLDIEKTLNDLLEDTEMNMHRIRPLTEMILPFSRWSGERGRVGLYEKREDEKD